MLVMRITDDIVRASLQIGSVVSFKADRISIDSRNISGGELFIAIKNGNNFVNDAINRGAVAAIVDNPNSQISGKTILVNDSLAALKSIGRYIKNCVSLKKTVGITGSVGKTTTRLWLSTILNHQFNSFAGIKNYNTIYGMPICFSMLEDNVDFGIFELGSSSPGEVSELAHYLNPDIGIITNIYESHIGKFGDHVTIAKEKMSIIGGIRDGGILIYDGDSKFSQNILDMTKRCGIRTISVGFGAHCDFSILKYDKRVLLKTPKESLTYNLSLNGKHYAYISACIVAAIHAIGLHPRKFLQYFEKLQLLNGRGVVRNFSFRNKTFSVVDDSYNASPTSVIAALDILSSMPHKLKVVVIGEMKELGAYTTYYHELIATKLSSLNIEHIFFVGDVQLWEAMNKVKNIICFEKLDIFAMEKVLEIVQNGCIVLLKGSRSVELDKFIEYVQCSTV
ncbi:MAG: UDP-N-acetylmuramoyl-tripeptide--D-alanyl-D-alanine ligase [Holosporales bacterium]|nr:UDP-N-acetylmuramoyl-tripeptide--D-alanyl-D-alanine ligase [Holosporales bacterium]